MMLMETVIMRFYMIIKSGFKIEKDENKTFSYLDSYIVVCLHDGLCG